MISILLLQLASTAIPPAGDLAPIAPAFENTIISTYPDGRQAKLWLNPDTTYRGQGRTGSPSSGHWSLRPDKLCFRQSRPVPIPFAWCTARVQGGVGTAWAAKAVTGERLRVELKAGR